MKRLISSFLLLIAASTAAHAQNWPQFRGPGATGVVEGPARPVKWDAAKSENVRWKLKIPGLAHSSPVVWGNKIFVIDRSNQRRQRRNSLWTLRRRRAC